MIPYAAVAVDLLNQREVVFRQGRVYDAIRASIAIPGVLNPCEDGKGWPVGRWRSDGQYPGEACCKNKGDELLVAVDVNGDGMV